MKKQIILTTSFMLSLLFTSCYSWYEAKTKMDYITEQTTLGEFFYRAPEITSLEAPTQVIASQGLYKDTIKLKWSEVNYATSYRIERAVIDPLTSENLIPEESDFEIIEKYNYNTTYEDKILTNALDSNQEYRYKYFYRISAENIGRGLNSSPYTPVNQGQGWLLPPPQNIEISKGVSEESITIKWDSVENANYYIIYRGENYKGFGMEVIGSINGSHNSFVDTIAPSEQGKEFYYKVCAQLKNGSESAFSPLEFGYALKSGAPQAPANIKVENGLGKSTSEIQIKWDAVSGAAGTNITYSVFRTSSVDKSFTQVTANLTTTSTIDTESLKPGIFYYYYVQTVADKNGEILKSAFTSSGPDSSDPAIGFLLSPPSSIEVLPSNHEGNVYLRWTPAIGSIDNTDDIYTNNYTYSIYIDNNQNGPFGTTIASKVLPELKTDEKGKNYYELEVTKYPYYKISTFNSEDTESTKSSVVAPLPDAPENVLASKTAKISDTSKFQPNANGVYPVEITWNAPSTDIPYGYVVYRSTKPDSSFRKLTETPIPAENQLIYIDENETARAGTYYYYKVVSVNSLGQGKKLDDPTNASSSKGYGAITRDQWFREYNKTVKMSQTRLSLMHKPNDMDKLGSESVNGAISGSLSYNASIAGLGAEITMHYSNYCEYWAGGKQENGPYFLINGNTDTTSNMSANGNMHGMVTCSGMYPGSADYGSLQIKGGAAGGGSYNVETNDLNGNVIFSRSAVNWTVGEE